jgi:hypothetical protein
VFENRVLRKICEAKRSEAIGDWRKQRAGELCYLYQRSLRLHMEAEWAGHVARMVKKKPA